MKPTGFFVILLASIQLTSLTYAQNKSKTTASCLYQGIEFKMNEVKTPAIPTNSVSIVDFGAKSDGVTLCTDAFRGAIESLAKQGGGRIIIPRDTWFTGPVTLKRNIELYSKVGSLVVFSWRMYGWRQIGV